MSSQPENVTSDGGVVKYILRTGQGTKPSLHARCLVHYIGKLVETGRIFLDTRAEGEAVHIVANRDAVLQAAGLNLAVSQMRVGELARIEIAPSYGYGAAGSFSFPCVPPQSKLEYEMELLGFDDVDEGQATSSMMYEDRLEAAERRRLSGNKLFSAGAFTDALGKYAMALSYMDQDFLFQLQGAHEEKANAVRIPVLLNIAACHIQLEDFQGAIDATSQVLTIDQSNIKALFRRGKARRLCGQAQAASQDLAAALKLAPRDPAVLKEMQMLRRSTKEDQEAVGNLFRGRFPQPPPRKSFWQWLWTSLRHWLGRICSSREKPHNA